MPRLAMYKSPWSIWKFHWRNRNNNRITIATIAAFLLAMALPYSLTNHIMGNIDRSVLDPAIGLDSWTPYIGWTFIIYVSFYLYYPAVAWYGRGDDSRVRELLGLPSIIHHDVGCEFDIHHLPTEVYIREQPSECPFWRRILGFGLVKLCIMLTIHTTPGRAFMWFNH